MNMAKVLHQHCRNACGWQQGATIVPQLHSSCCILLVRVVTGQPEKHNLFNVFRSTSLPKGRNAG